jgi:CRISPR-associated endonuclease/helicase Cas3
LLHSRFRPPDRENQLKGLLADPPPEGTICVSTQVVEAGVDVSATTLFTEIAPWASMVQRFGRCNRRGDDPAAHVYWIGLPEDEAEAAKVALPYGLEQLRESQSCLEKCDDVGPSRLPKVELLFQHTHVIRCKDIVELFDTTPDLAGNDIDIDRYVREVEETDVRVFWRTWANRIPPNDMPPPKRCELCSAPVGEFRKFVKDKRDQIWRWDFLDGDWARVGADSVLPGQTYLIHTAAGGYDPTRGWDSRVKSAVELLNDVMSDVDGSSEDSTDDDTLSQKCNWQTVAEHTAAVCTLLKNTLDGLSLDAALETALLDAARWHDRGKAHATFQEALPDGPPQPSSLWAKAPGTWKHYTRKHFRHELASALAVLLPDAPLKAADRDLVAYLIAAHHGKVRLSIRSLPNEKRPDTQHDDRDHERRFARGVWDGDALPDTALGDGVIAPAVVLSLEPMELGLCELPPFAGTPSWLERTLRLRGTLGPFKLAYLEALLRAADRRASAAAMTSGKLLPKEADHV